MAGVLISLVSNIMNGCVGILSWNLRFLGTFTAVLQLSVTDPVIEPHCTLCLLEILLI